jgi:iron complex transport system substrate-binding protein
MVSRLRIYVAMLLGLVCIGCGGNQLIDNASFSQSCYVPHYATGFHIDADEHGNTLIRVTRPWQGDNLPEQTLAIFHDADVAKNYSGQYIAGYARRVVCMSSSHIAMLDAVGAVESIVGVSGKQYIMNEYVASSSAIKDVGYDSNLDYETILSLSPDVVLMYGITAENSAVTSKFRELGIPYLYLGDYTEQSPLGKAEWMVAVAEIVGCREGAEQIFLEIEERYNLQRDSVSEGQRPKVMFNLPYQDVWYMPSDDSYMVRLVEDAGGEYVFKGENPTGGSQGISLEQALMLVGAADIWLNPGQCLSLDEVRSLAPNFVGCEVVKRGNIYNNNNRRTASGGSDFWESAIVCPDIVLRDMIAIMRGEYQELYYHHKLE